MERLTRALLVCAFAAIAVAVPRQARAYSVLGDEFAHLDLAISTYPKTVSELTPEITWIAWRDKREEIERSRRACSGTRSSIAAHASSSRPSSARGTSAPDVRALRELPGWCRRSVR